MPLPVSPALAAFVVAVVLIAGAVNAVAGFGFALVGTMALASVLDPSTAVVFMILPVLAVNLSLVRELSTEDLRTCGRRFTPLIVAALAGTLVGMWFLDVVPARPLRLGLGLVTLAFVVSVQKKVAVPGLERLKSICFVESTGIMVAVGGISGLLFGGTNVGVQLVAYLKSLDLSHGVFVGVVAMVFLGLNVVRVGAAGALGIYPDIWVFGASAAVAVPSWVGVAVGRRFRHRVDDRLKRFFVLGLLTVVGLRLVAAGTGVF